MASVVTDFQRRPQQRYDDPLARVWIDCAERIGFRVVRTGAAYATYDGCGTIGIGTDDLLDPDDSLAQIIFHELCHALVESDQQWQQPDWGLDNTGDRDVWREHACLRLQAYLAGTVGLRDFFAPTTDFRLTFWQALPDDPFAAPPGTGGRREASCVAARLGVWRASRAPWTPHLDQALAASAAIAVVVPRSIRSDAVVDAGPMGTDDAVVAEPESSRLPSLWATVSDAPLAHPAGHAPIARYLADQGCVTCAWRRIKRNRQRCLHAPRRSIPDEAPACTRWEPAGALDCQACGACCREAYHAVELTSRERIIRRRPELIVKQEGRICLRREGERCAALVGGTTPHERYVCDVYELRPKTCREFERGSENCLDARRRVGLSL
jgi:hypothetical protein